MFFWLDSFAAQIVVTSKDDEGQKRQIMATSFPDYEPFSVTTAKGTSGDELHTVFDDAFKLFSEENRLEYLTVSYPSYQEAVNMVRQGETDILLGSYYGSKIYSGLEYVYPAVLHNPIHVVMLPDQISKISAVDDLSKLRGIYIQSEYFSDYMLQNFKNYNISSVPTPYEAYEQLFTGKIDYIIGSYYFNYVYALKTGLKDYVAFSKSTLWNMPLFVSVSKASKRGISIKNALTRFFEKGTFSQAVSKALEDYIHQLENQSIGIVPPKFVRLESLNEQTPADEQNTLPITEN